MFTVIITAPYRPHPTLFTNVSCLTSARSLATPGYQETNFIYEQGNIVETHKYEEKA